MGCLYFVGYTDSITSWIQESMNGLNNDSNMYINQYYVGIMSKYICRFRNYSLAPAGLGSYKYFFFYGYNTKPINILLIGNEYHSLLGKEYTIV